MSFRVVALGEILWDLLAGGRQLGGAPANFACHARALGAEAGLISRVGRDALGREASNRLIGLGVSTDGLQLDDERLTGTVAVAVSSDGQPQFTIREEVAWDAIEVTPSGLRLVAEADAVCFGTLAQRNPVSRAALGELVAASPRAALRVFDVNLRQRYHSPAVIEHCLAASNVLKVNDAELPQLASLFQLTGDLRSQLGALADRAQLRCAVCTRGAHGSLLLLNGRWSDHPGLPARVVDTVGAGDSFTAAMVMGLLAGWDADTINDRANRVAAHVCSQPGATPELPANLRELFTSLAGRRPEGQKASKTLKPS